MDAVFDTLTKIELAADDVLDVKAQIIDLENKKQKAHEADKSITEAQKTTQHPRRKHWLAAGDMFIKLDYNDTKNCLIEEKYQLSEGINKLRDDLKEKVANLRQLEGKPELTAFNLKPLSKKELLALRTGFKL